MWWDGVTGYEQALQSKEDIHEDDVHALAFSSAFSAVRLAIEGGTVGGLDS
jgi:hypothetical protein